MPPSAAHVTVTNPDTGFGFINLLGADYERKKQKLQHELHMDYKQYIAKKREQKTSEPYLQPRELSLPIDEKRLVKDKMREESNKEYNLFIQDQTQNGKLKRGTPLATFKPGHIQVFPASPESILNTHTNTPQHHRERPPRRDAATLTEAIDDEKSMGTGDPGHQGQRHSQIYRPKEHTHKDQELEFRHRRREARQTPEYEKEGECRTREGGHNSLQMTDSMRAAARQATSKDKAVIATGLIIGVPEEQTASQMRKEHYRQELLKQIAEQQKNKMREKNLELRVAATGATDPEKEPGRLKQFGANSWRRDITPKSGVDLKVRGKDTEPRPKDNKSIKDTEQGGPRGKYQVALSQRTGTVPESGIGAPQSVPLLDDFNEDYHKDFSTMLGDVTIPRVASVPPPVPPAITNNYKTPYDAAYFYYGTRNPMDPHLPYLEDGLSREVQQFGNFHIPSQRPPPLRPSDLTEETDEHRIGSMGVGKILVDKSKQRSESTLSYQEALRHQIKEREERKRREKEEKEQYDAKIEAEMMAYNPWGRSGGGAPIKDNKGNLFSDLNQMHRINEETYRNPVVRNSEVRTPRFHGLSGFNDQATPQQLHMQDSYREALTKQIEENKRRQAEEREQMKIEEEREERRLTEQRALIQREYEEEQRKQKKIEHRIDNQGRIYESKKHHPEEERKTRQEEEPEIPEITMDREEKNVQRSYEREPSPPIPTLQKKQTNLMVSRPSSVASRLSPRTEHSVSAPHYQPMPAKIPSQQDGKQEVIRNLSALRWHLDKVKREMEAELGQADHRENHYTPPNRRRGRPRVDAFESAYKETNQTSTGRSYSGAPRVNMQNIKEFNQLKYRDTASREVALHMYPDPPTDAQSLDIQQQALLHEQQHKLNRMKRAEEQDFLGQQLGQYYPRNQPARATHRDFTLPSETTFIDVYSGEASEERGRQQRPRQPSAQRTAPLRRHDYEEVAVSVNDREPDIQVSVGLNDKAKVRPLSQQPIRIQDTGEQNGRSGLSRDEADALSLSSALERHVSMETVATEPWLRPGTSDASKDSGSRLRSHSRMDAPPWLTHRA